MENNVENTFNYEDMQKLLGLFEDACVKSGLFGDNLKDCTTTVQLMPQGYKFVIELDATDSEQRI